MKRIKSMKALVVGTLLIFLILVVGILYLLYNSV